MRASGYHIAPLPHGICGVAWMSPSHPYRQPQTPSKGGMQYLASTRGQSHLGCALDVAFALVIAEHHITENDVLAVACLFLSHDTATGQRRIVGYRSTEVGSELFQRAGREKFGEHAR